MGLGILSSSITLWSAFFVLDEGFLMYISISVRSTSTKGQLTYVISSCYFSQCLRKLQAKQQCAHQMEPRKSKRNLYLYAPSEATNTVLKQVQLHWLRNTKEEPVLRLFIAMILQRRHSYRKFRFTWTAPGKIPAHTGKHFNHHWTRTGSHSLMGADYSLSIA